MDMTEAMLAKARRRVDLLDLENVQSVPCRIGELRLEDERVDVAVSNGVFNFGPEEQRALT